MFCVVLSSDVLREVLNIIWTPNKIATYIVFLICLHPVTFLCVVSSMPLCVVIICITITFFITIVYLNILISMDSDNRDQLSHVV